MKTKQVLPWNLKVGQKLVTNDFFTKHDRADEITDIKKEIGRFTGRAIWRVTCAGNIDFPHWSFHAKMNRLPAQKATIQID